MCGRVNVSDLEGLDELMAAIACGQKPHQPATSAPVTHVQARADSADGTPLNLKRRWNVPPTQTLAVIHHREGSPQLAAMRWGLETTWRTTTTQRPDILFNARSESVFDKATFREHARERRALVVVNGYYEWEQRGGHRHPWYIHPTQSRYALLAAIWNGNDAAPACCVLTREANTTLVHVHQRMPVRVPVEQALNWMQNDNTCRQQLCDDAVTDWACRRVSDYVNAVGNEGPECLESPRQGSLW